MVERLGGQGNRPVRARRPAPGVSDSRAHLNEAVEAPALGPGTGPPVCVVRYIDERGVPRAPPGRAVPQAVERVCAIAVDNHVRSGNEALEHGAPLGLAQVEERPALAGRHLGKERADLLEAGRVEAEHVGPVRGEHAGAHGARHDAREVEDADPSERRARRVREAGRGGSRRHAEEWLRVHGRALRVSGPLGGGAKACGATAGGDHGGLEIFGAPASRCVRDGVARLGDSEDAEHSLAVMSVVGVEADPAVFRAVVASDRVPDRRQRPALGREVPLGPERDRRVAAVDVDGAKRLSGAYRVHRRDRRRRRGDRGGRERADVVDRGQAGRARDLEGRGRGPVERRPDSFEQGFVVSGHDLEFGVLSLVVNVDYRPR